MLDRLELPTDARRTVEFLIRNHLLMSQVAFRRDFDDPHVVAVCRPHRIRRLKLLCPDAPTWAP
jgi:UTP:GlnB (protein PII) uridylyltransferase